MTDTFRDWDAAYLLGALGPDDRRAFERHLSTCPSCATAVAELAGLPGLLGKLGRDEAAALVSGAVVAVRAPDLVRGLAASVRRKRRRNRGLVGVAALAVAGLLAVFAVGAFAAPASQVAGPTATAAPLTAAVAMDQVTPGVMTADLQLTEKGWGTRFDWTCTYNTAGWQPGDAPASYELVAIDTAGNETIVATWNSTGDRAGGLVASSSVATSAIRSVEIRLAGADTTLLRTDL